MDIIELYKRLYPNLAEIEEQRKLLLKRSGRVLIASLAAALGILWFLVTEVRFLNEALVLSLLPFGVAAIMINLYYKEFRTLYKKNLVQKVVSHLFPSLTYQFNTYVPQHYYKASFLFSKNYSRYRGEDYVSGRIGKTDLFFSELHTEVYVKNSKGGGSYHTVFKGIYFVADFHKDFDGITILLPDFAEKRFGRLGAFLQKASSAVDGRPGEIVKLENPDFERKFKVVSTDAVEARYILSPALMDRILDFHSRTGFAIRLSFVNSQMHLAISDSKNRFEPQVMASALNSKNIYELVSDINLMIGIVEDLNLNTRIWSKA